MIEISAAKVITVNLTVRASFEAPFEVRVAYHDRAAFARVMWAAWGLGKGLHHVAAVKHLREELNIDLRAAKVLFDEIKQYSSVELTQFINDMPE